MKKNLLIVSFGAILALVSCGTGGASSTSPATTSETPAESSKEETPATSEVVPSSEEYQPANVDSFCEKVVPFKMLNFSQEDQTYYVMKGATAKYYQINDETIPYMSFKTFTGEYLNYEQASKNHLNYQSSFDGKVATVLNPVNGSYFTYDTTTREITYHDYDFFFSTQKNNTNPYIGAVFGSPFFNDSLTTYDYYPGNQTISYSLADYSIPQYVYNNDVYLPYEAMNVLFGVNATAVCYAGDTFYYYDGANSDLTVSYNNYITSQGTEWITEEYLTSCYNSLAMAFDMYYGLDERQSRVEDGKTIKYMEKGAYEMLAPYKERLLSTEPDVSQNALYDLYKYDLDDGGHGNYTTLNMLTTKTFKRADIAGAETLNTLNSINGIVDARKETKATITDELGEDAASGNGYYKEYGDTAYIQFNGFDMKLSDYSAEAIADLPYYTDTITLFHYANEQIRNNPEIDNVVIDLAANGGGAMFVNEFVSSWVCGGAEGTLCNVKSGSFISYRMEADVNLDGGFSASDYLPSSMNVYVLTSNGSFSCGNKLPCNIKDNRPENTHFIGARTGGGSCAVAYIPFAWLGGMLRISSNTQIGRKEATAEKFVSDEAGVSPDFFEIKSDNYAEFADISTIISKIHSKTAE